MLLLRLWCRFPPDSNLKEKTICSKVILNNNAFIGGTFSSHTIFKWFLLTSSPGGYVKTGQLLHFKSPANDATIQLVIPLAGS